MLQIINQNLFDQIVSQSLAKVQNDSRWTNAIKKAVKRVEDQDQANFIEYLADDNQLIIHSQTSNQVYSSNGFCQCEAFFQGFPCWHRAAARLVRLYFEALKSPATEGCLANLIEDYVCECPNCTKHEMDSALYLKPQTQSTKINGYRI